MKMSKKISIVLIIILSVFVVSFSVGLGFLISSGKNFNDFFIFNLNFDNYSKKLIDSKTFDEEKNINITFDRGDVLVEESSNNKINVEIYSDNVKKHSVTLDNDINVTLLTSKISSFRNIQNKIVIMIPKKYSKKITINGKIGDIKVNDFSNLDLDVTLSTGDIKIEKINNIDAILSTGDIKVNDVINAKIELKTGDVEIDSVKELKSTIKTGDLEVGLVKDLTAKLSIGDIEIDRVINSVDIKLNVGDLDITKAIINKNSNIKIKTGDIRINKLVNAKVDAKTRFGSLSINNDSKGAKNKIKVMATTGDIRID